MRLGAGWAVVTRPRVVDAGLVVVAVAITALTSAGPMYVVAGLCVASLSLLVRRARPALVTAITVGADLAAVPLLLAAGVALPPMLGAPATIALYGLGRHRRKVWLVAAVVVAGCFAFDLAIHPNNVVGNVMQILAAVWLGRMLRLRHRLAEFRKRRSAEGAVRAERRRIARELHDVVAHHITVINILVGAGRTPMATDPASAERSLVTAERTARRAMAEMRQLLDVLKADDSEPADHMAIGADRLPTLVEQAGVPAELEVTGEAVPLPAAVDHAVYRVVQESLTNTGKHAPGARARVRLSYLAGCVEVEVTDDGTAPPARGDGHGLSGMAERVSLCGGLLRAGPRPEGGFQVHAVFPVAALEEVER